MHACLYVFAEICMHVAYIKTYYMSSASKHTVPNFVANAAPANNICMYTHFAHMQTRTHKHTVQVGNLCVVSVPEGALDLHAAAADVLFVWRDAAKAQFGSKHGRCGGDECGYSLHRVKFHHAIDCRADLI